MQLKARRKSLLALRATTRIDTWNARAMYDHPKSKGMKNYKIGLLGLSEVG